ncbi:MAG TPA: deoxyhypusine synthase [Candidatus Methanomethylia archaeon]|nr:deoxyhypusine synthase [Candidatus Methanomethylicia archaeon]
MKVRDFKPVSNVDRLVRQLRYTAFNGRALAEAVDTLQEMISDQRAIRLLGFAGALIPAGFRRVIAEFIDNGFFHAVVTTGASVTHDLAMALGGEVRQLQKAVSDAALRRMDRMRIYDLYTSSKSFLLLEGFLKKALKNLQDGVYSTYELLRYLGTLVDDENSFVAAAAKRDVKIIVPAFYDSILGVQLWILTRGRSLKIDSSKDLSWLVNLQFDAKSGGCPVGAFILGGGVPKNFIFQSALIADHPLCYVVQVTVDVPEYGGLSGATLEEAKSWGKVSSKARTVTVYCDYSIALPLIASALLARVKRIKA